MPEYELITPNELKKMLELSTALDLNLLCTINDTIIKIRGFGTWNYKIKIYECAQDDKRQIFEMINEHYKLLLSRK